MDMQSLYTGMNFLAYSKSDKNNKSAESKSKLTFKFLKR